MVWLKRTRFSPLTEEELLKQPGVKEIIAKVRELYPDPEDDDGGLYEDLAEVWTYWNDHPWYVVLRKLIQRLEMIRDWNDECDALDGI
jgi:hypothetical protein